MPMLFVIVASCAGNGPPATSSTSIKLHFPARRFRLIGIIPLLEVHSGTLKIATFYMQLASFIDHTILKQTTTHADIARVCTEALQYGFASACIPPVYVAEAMGFLKSSSVKVCTVIGFPFGYHAVSVKLREMEEAVAD